MSTPPNGPRDSNALARELLTILNPRDGYFLSDADAQAGAEGVTLDRAAKYWYVEFKRVNAGLDNDALATELEKQLKSLSLHRDGEIPPDVKSTIKKLLIDSPTEAKFAENIVDDVRRDATWIALTAPVDGQKVSYVQNPYGDGIPSLQEFLPQGFVGLFNALLPDKIEQTENAELRAVREALGNNPSAATGQAVIDKLMEKTDMNIDTAGKAELIAKADAIIGSTKFKDEPNAGKKADMLIEALRLHAEGFNNIEFASQALDPDLLENGGNQYKLADGRVLFDFDPDKGFKNIDELNEARGAAGLDKVSAGAHTYRIFPGMGG